MVRLFRRKASGEQKTPEAKPEEKDLLLELCEGDQALYEALSYVILLNPTRLLELKGIDEYLKAGAEAEASGDAIKARINYESFGKLAIYFKDEAKAREAFTKALRVTADEARGRIYRTVLDSFDRVMSIATKYYEAGVKSSP